METPSFDVLTLNYYYSTKWRRKKRDHRTLRKVLRKNPRVSGTRSVNIVILQKIWYYFVLTEGARYFTDAFMRR